MAFTTSPAITCPTLETQTVSRPDTTSCKEGATSTAQVTEAVGLSCIRDYYKAAGFSTAVTSVLMSSWRTGTKKQYNTYIRKWLEFCCERTIDKYSPTLVQALSFLESLHGHGLSYSGLNTARSALSAIISIPDCQTFGTHPVVMRFMKGVFELQKPQPKYTQVWDVSTVLKYLATLKLNSLSLKNLTLKLVMLLLFVSGQRGQAIHSLSIHSDFIRF